MAIHKAGPFFNLKAVIRQTGLKPDTLRAWERRYGLPMPERSAGGHRLYTQRDIDTVMWLMARQREGLSISRAVELWQGIVREERDPLQAATPTVSPGPPIALPAEGANALANLRREWISFCQLYDEQKAEQTLAQAFSLFPPELVVLELLQKSVAEIGKGWYLGDVTVQQEHYCSALAVRRLEALVMSAPPPRQPGRILAACPPGEHHVISLLVLTYLLRRRGWSVVYLGADVPAERIEITIDAAQPQLVILAAQQLHSAASLLEMAEVLQRRRIPLAFGGLIFNVLPALRAHIPGHFLGESVTLAPQAVERLMTAPQAVQQMPAASSAALPAAGRLRLARDHFLEQQSLIDGDVAQSVDHAALNGQRLAMINRELGRNISAALTLGDLAYLGSDLRWVEGLMENRQMPVPLLKEYLRAYRNAARKHLDERGQPLLSWLEGLFSDGDQTPVAWNSDQ